GGTDLPGWYTKHGSFLIAAAMDKYIYATGSDRICDDKIWLSYSRVEICDDVSEVENALFRKCLEKFGNPKGLEIHSISELPGGSGCGSSGAFLVATLKLMSLMQRKVLDTQELAELACQVEMVDLGHSSGKQDQYVSAFGGIISMEIDTEGQVTITPLSLDKITVKHLNHNLMFYYSGITREANEILREQNQDIGGRKQSSVDAMHRIQEIGYESKEALESGDLDRFGRLLHEHWNVKKSMSNMMSSSFIDETYEFAMGEGALGGKVMGAGGGGFFMFYVPAEKHDSFRKRMRERHLTEMDWQFDYSGVTQVYTN
ncbi:MAG: galactokinase, partial [Planctomycetota bacterium]|nr:galactokinase [Planctomycetota bacterium]